MDGVNGFQKCNSGMKNIIMILMMWQGYKDMIMVKKKKTKDGIKNIIEAII